MKKNYEFVPIYEDISKFLRVMKITAVLIMVMCMHTFASSYAQTTKFNFSMNDATIEEVIEHLEQESEFYFFMKDDRSVLNKKVDVNYEDASIEKVLDELLEDTNLTYKLVDKYIAVVPAGEEVKIDQQKRTITGTITDLKGEPIPGASVIVRGTTTGAITDFDGNFSLVIPEDANVLIFSFVGMATQEVEIGDKTIFEIVLSEDVTDIEEVVVTALGMKKAEKVLGYSVQSVKGDIVQQAPEANVLSNLTGKVAGLTVYNSTEFFRGPSISLRGEKPLVVIDGVPVSTDFWDISPNDIEEMSILKGATASALYGSKGAGGAIMITTKKGKTDKLSVSISSSTMFKAGYVAIPEPQRVYGTGDNGLYSYGDGAGGGINDAGTYVWGPRMDERDASTASGWKEIPQWDSPVDPETGERIPTPWRSRGKNNLRNFLEPGYISTNNISVTQSGEKGSFRASVSHAYQKGQVPNTELNNTTVTLGGTVNMFDKLKIESSLSYNKQFSPNYPSVGYGGSGYVYNLLVWSGVDFDVRDFRDYWLVEDVQQKYYQYTKWYNNPYFLAYENERAYFKDGVYGFVTLNYDFSDNLKLTSRTGVNTHSVRNNTNTPKSMGQGKGNYSQSSNYDFAVNSDVILTYDKDVTEDFNVNALAGGTLNFSEYRSLSAWTDDLNVPGFYALSNSTNPVGASNYTSKKQVNSLFGKLSLGYKNGIFVDVTGRNDWSSSLPAETRSYFYPSVALSGIVSEFVDLPEVFSFLKLRASWTLSKKDMALYTITPAYSVSSDVWNGQSTASYPSSIRGAGVSPEETRNYEIGTDLRFFDSRLKFDFSYYNTLRFNMIRNAPISDASGFGSKTVNTDEEHEKKGFEIVLSGQPVKTKDFVWDATLNWSTYRWYWNNIDTQFSPNVPWVNPGARMDYLVGWDWERDPQGNIIHGSNGFPIQSNYQSVLGFTGEDFVWGWSNNLKYKDFNLAFSFDGRVGGLMHSQTNQAMWNSGTHPESVNEYREAAVNGINSYVGSGVVVVSGEVIRDEQGTIIEDTREFGPNMKKVNYITYAKRFNPYVGNLTSQNLFDETFMKLREVALNYNVPKSIMEKIGATGATVGVVGRNLWLWTKEVDHVDPDPSEDNLSSASYRNIGFNVKLTF